MGRRTFYALAAAGLVAIIGAAVTLINRPSGPVSNAVLPTGGTYAGLSAGQRRLIDDWVDRLGKAGGTPIAAADLYDDLALSTRTTFEAVTHALERTALTGADGRPLNLTALDLIVRLDRAIGSAPGQGGDKQFRLYVEVAPGTQDRLAESAQFKRQVDNTVYHKGYPTCFRGVGGTPSIQFSLSADGRRADVDVDYRSSTFPVMLINGHLTASNSDIRAGNNDERHNQHWSGLTNWWHSFLGIPMIEAPRDQAAAIAQSVATSPRLKAEAKPEEAIEDFLRAWLMEDAAGVAAGYVDPRAFACLELERGDPADRGVARLQIARAMQSIRALTGAPANLADVVQAVAVQAPTIKPVSHRFGELFTLYEVRDDLAADMDCDARLRPEQVAERGAARFNGFMGALFRLGGSRVRGQVVATLWQHADDGWRLVAYDVEPAIAQAPETAAPPPEAPPAAAVAGDAAMIASATAFLDSWFVRKDIPAAFRFLSPRTYACYNVFRADDQPEATGEAAGRLIEQRMGALAEWVGPASSLDAVMAPAETHHPAFRPVRNGALAFAVVALPDAMSSAIDCSTLGRGDTPWFDAAAATEYGRYYAASVRLERGGPDAAVLWTIWERQGDSWRIVSYRVLVP